MHALHGIKELLSRKNTVAERVGKEEFYTLLF